MGEKAEREKRIREGLLLLAEQGVEELKLQMETMDPETKREIAWKALDRSGFKDKEVLQVGMGPSGEMSSMLGNALRGAFAGLAEGLGLHPGPLHHESSSDMRVVTPLPEALPEVVEVLPVEEVPKKIRKPVLKRGIHEKG